MKMKFIRGKESVKSQETAHCFRNAIRAAERRGPPHPNPLPEERENCWLFLFQGGEQAQIGRVITNRISRALLIAIFAGALAGCTRPAKIAAEAADSPKIDGEKVIFSTNAPQLGYLAIEPARERSVVATGLNGRLAWDDDITARVFTAVSGRTIEIEANPGQPVAPGDALARIKSPDFSQAQADARKAAADLRAAERTLNRTRELLEHGAAAEKDLEAAEAEHTRSLSEKERALATLSLYGGNPDSAGVDGIFSLKAPIGGVIVEKTINPGQEVRSDQVGDKPLFVISDPTRLWLYLDVTEADVASMKLGQEVVVRARALPDKIFRGRLEVIGQGLDPATRTIKARCLVDNADKLLRAEMYVSADVSSATSGVDVPTKAVFLKDNQHYVFVETVPGQFERRAVRLGLESDGRSVVVEGLNAGQRVVSQGCLMLEAMVDGENS
jgi:cobalt-zinc-cadmium efflux system membrane fusion protein